MNFLENLLHRLGRFSFLYINPYSDNSPFFRVSDVVTHQKYGNTIEIHPSDSYIYININLKIISF